jgi:hypothetical protein
LSLVKQGSHLYFHELLIAFNKRSEADFVTSPEYIHYKGLDEYENNQPKEDEDIGNDVRSREHFIQPLATGGKERCYSIGLSAN